MHELPIFELSINPKSKDIVVDAIALVENPAIEENFISFSSDDAVQFEFSDERMELIGPAFIPNMKIYRKDAQGREFYVFAKEDTVRMIAQEYFRRGFQNNLNLDHSDVDANSFVFQSYIVNSTLGMNAPKGMDVPDGSWIVGVKVNDKQVWKDIKAGKRKGFSIEGLFQLAKADFSKVDYAIDSEITSLLADISKLLTNKK